MYNHNHYNIKLKNENEYWLRKNANEKGTLMTDEQKKVARKYEIIVRFSKGNSKTSIAKFFI